MSEISVQTAAPVQTSRMPGAVRYIVGNEAAERFSYYGMKGILAGYVAGAVVHGGLGQSEDTATSLVALFSFVNYFMPLFGGWLSDRLIGRYHTILWVSLFYCAGHGVLACSDMAGTVHGKMIFLYVGLGLIAFGSGGIKPCVSAFVGDQFKPEQAHLLQKAYGAFYWAINFGSFFSFLVIPWIKNTHGYRWAFAVPGLAMAIATFVFWIGTKHYVRVPPSRQTGTAGFIPVFFAALKAQPGLAIGPWLNLMTAVGLPFLGMLALIFLSFNGQITQAARIAGWTGIICFGLWNLLVVLLSLARQSELPNSFWQAARNRFRPAEIEAASTVGPILFVFALIPVFWSLFDQSNTTWVLQGYKMVSFRMLGLEIGAEQMQSVNPALVMILVPLLTLGVYPRIGRFASQLKRMSFGLFLTAGSYVVVYLIQKQIEAGTHLCVAWQAVPYFVLTTAEVLVSTTGLEFAFTQSAPEMKSTIMSFWMLTISFGNLFVSAITRLLSGPSAAEQGGSVSSGRFLMYAGLTAVVAVLFSAVAAAYRYRDPGGRSGASVAVS